MILDNVDLSYALCDGELEDVDYLSCACPFIWNRFLDLMECSWVMERSLSEVLCG